MLRKERASKCALCILGAVLTLVGMMCVGEAAVRSAFAQEQNVQSRITIQEDIIKNISAERTSGSSTEELEKRILAPTSDIDQLEARIREQVNRRQKKNFITLYQTMWRSQNMDRALSKAVDEAFEEQTADLMWGTAGIQLATNRNNIIESIQEAVAFKITSSYDAFLRTLEARWDDTLRSDIIHFYSVSIAQSLATDTNSMFQSWLRQDYSAIVEDKGVAMMGKLEADIKNKNPDLDISAGKMLVGFTGALFQKQITRQVGRMLAKAGVKKIGASTAGKLVGAAIPVVNIAMMAWGAYDIASMAWKVKDDVRNHLRDNNRTLYFEQVPVTYWEVMEPYVVKIFTSAYIELQDAIEQAKVISNNPKITELANELSENERRVFTERIAAIMHDLGGSGRNDEILDNFGPLIISAQPANFPRLASMMRRVNLDRLKMWFDTAGELRFYNLAASFPEEVWDYFPPNQESLEMLTWMMSNLTPVARTVAVSMSASDIHWLMNDMPSRYIPRLFAAEQGPSAISDEIARLSKISNKERRIPWMGMWEYRWTRYGTKIMFSVGAIVLLPLLLRLISFMARRKLASDKSRAVPQPVTVKALDKDAILSRVPSAPSVHPSETSAHEDDSAPQQDGSEQHKAAYDDDVDTDANSDDGISQHRDWRRA